MKIWAVLVTAALILPLSGCATNYIDNVTWNPASRLNMYHAPTGVRNLTMSNSVADSGQDSVQSKPLAEN